MLLVVLENITVNPAQNMKLVSGNSGRPFDLSKITVLNPVNTPKVSGSLGNVVLMPDGKIKAISTTSKTPGTDIILKNIRIHIDVDNDT